MSLKDQKEIERAYIRLHLPQDLKEVIGYLAKMRIESRNLTAYNGRNYDQNDIYYMATRGLDAAYKAGAQLNWIERQIKELIRKM